MHASSAYIDFLTKFGCDTGQLLNFKSLGFNAGRTRERALELGQAEFHRTGPAATRSGTPPRQGKRSEKTPLRAPLQRIHQGCLFFVSLRSSTSLSAARARKD
jgi:hypothetical protein